MTTIFLIYRYTPRERMLTKFQKNNIANFYVGPTCTFYNINTKITIKKMIFNLNKRLNRKKIAKPVHKTLILRGNILIYADFSVLIAIEHTCDVFNFILFF